MPQCKQTSVVLFLGREFLSIQLRTSNALKIFYMYTIFLVSIFDYNMFKYIFFLYIEIHKYTWHSLMALMAITRHLSLM